MSSYSRIIFELQNTLNTTFARLNRKRSLSIFAVAVLLVIGSVSLVIIKSGAQELSPVKTKEIPKNYINQDIRLTNQTNLNKILERNLNVGERSLSDVKEKGREQAFKINTALINLKKSNPTAEVAISPVTGAVEVLRSSKFLTKASRREAQYIGLDFIRENKELYGLDETDIANLNYVGESVNETSGLRLVIFEQKVNDRLVFQGECKISINRDGRVIQSLSNLAPHATARASAIENLLSPQEALVRTMATVDVALDAEAMSLTDSVNAEAATENEVNDEFAAKIKVNDPQIKGTVESKIVYFPVAPGVVIPAWSQVIWGKDADYYALVDATDGTLLFRKNIRSDVSTQPARFNVFVQADGSTPADSPSPLSPTPRIAGFQPAGIAPTLVNMLTVQNTTASPNGWIDDCPAGGCTANETQTLGNNTLVCVDRLTTTGNANVCDTDANGIVDGSGRPTGNPDANGRNRDFLGTSPRDFQTGFLPAPQGGNPEAGTSSTVVGTTGTQFLRGSATHQFYVTNWYHDKLYALGFTPAARNFQVNNFGGGGAGNDRVLVDVQDGTSTNNANFSTPADGTPGRAQMYNFTGPTVDRDGGLDAEILMHELTHGTSNRLIGNGSGLVWRVGAGMGEGWSDFYALSLLNNTNADDPNASYASGSYATYKLATVTYVDNYTYGIRRFPYSTVNTVNPLTWADVDDVTNDLSGGIAPSPLNFNGNGAMEVHNTGEIWANTLWEVRSRVIADPAGANGDVPTGNNTTLSIVTDAMRLFTPNNPSFVQARNALIDADCAANAACPNEVSIWGGFADRGLGYNAVAPLGYQYGYAAPHTGIGESFEMPNLDVNATTISDTVGGNGSGAIDPNELIRLSVNLRNPYRGAARNVGSVTATLSTSTPGITISDDTAVYPAIAAQGNSNPTAGDTFAFSVPSSMGCGSAIRFTITTNSTLGTASKNFILRVGAPSGTAAPVTYTRDPNPNITIPDNSPRGIGDSLTITDDYEIADLNFRMDSLTHPRVVDISVMLRAPNGYGTDLISAIGLNGTGQSGTAITNMVIDDTAAAPNDQLSSTLAQAPFTDDFLPIFNAPSWTSVGFPTDPVGQLSRYNGLSTLGTWNLRVADQISGATGGTLNQWSMIVTPRAFVCTSFVPTAAVVTISGRVMVPQDLGLTNAIVTLTDSHGVTRTSVTGKFGNFAFRELAAGETYILSVSSKRYTYAPQIISPTEDLTDIIFSPQ